jgi:hypothetical protein
MSNASKQFIPEHLRKPSFYALDPTMKYPRYLDFEANWNSVLSSLKTAKVRDALEVSLSAYCLKQGFEWDGITAPWVYSRPKLKIEPDADSLRSYRCWGANRFFTNFWGTIGEQLFPSLEWKAAREIDGDYAVALGYEGDRLAFVADLNFASRNSFWDLTDKGHLQLVMGDLTRLAPNGICEVYSVSEHNELLRGFATWHRERIERAARFHSVPSGSKEGAGTRV